LPPRALSKISLSLSHSLSLSIAQFANKWF
jgi:hypothetical protein